MVSSEDGVGSSSVVYKNQTCRFSRATEHFNTKSLDSALPSLLTHTSHPVYNRLLIWLMKILHSCMLPVDEDPGLL